MKHLLNGVGIGVATLELLVLVHDVEVPEVTMGELDVITHGEVSDLDLELVVIRGNETEFEVFLREIVEQVGIEVLEELCEGLFPVGEDPGVIYDFGLVDVVHSPVDFVFRHAFCLHRLEIALI